MTTTPDTTRLELAITELRGSMDAGMARIEGSLALLVQRAEHADQRAAAQDADLRRLDARQDELERVAITRADLDTAVAGMRDLVAEHRAQLDEAARRKLMVWTIVVAVVAALLGAGVAAAGIVAAT